MSLTLTVASSFIGLALILYTYAVWGEQLTGHLRRGFILSFWAGFLCDTVGTSIMMAMTRGGTAQSSPVHAITGLAAIALMGVHAVWALMVWLREDQHAAALFHRFSRYVYLLWLVAFATGLAIGSLTDLPTIFGRTLSIRG